MKCQQRVGFAAQALGLSAIAALSAITIAGCFSNYKGDCNRDPELDCFWGAGAAGGAGGATGGAGGTSMTTTPVVLCGDHIQDEGEACDDGNTVDCDGCRGDCSAKETGCGDGFKCGTEECDLGPANADTGACTTMCKDATCGDGFQQAGEECDDGNAAGGDNCSSDCKVECAPRNLPFADNPANITVFLDPATMHCYARVSKPQKTWDGAYTACLDWGGSLFAFDKLGEVTTLLNGLPGLTGESWVGGNDMMTDGVFVWANGDNWPVMPPWAAGEPNFVGGGCVSIDASGALHDHGCTEIPIGAYICELDLASLIGP